MMHFADGFLRRISVKIQGELELKVPTVISIASREGASDNDVTGFMNTLAN